MFLLIFKRNKFMNFFTTFKLDDIIYQHHIKELLFLKMDTDTGVEEFLEGYQIFRSRFI